jgi:hypothetical protein
MYIGKTYYLRDPHGHHSDSPRFFYTISADGFHGSYKEPTEFPQGVRVVCQKLLDFRYGSSEGSLRRSRDVQG